MLKLRKPQNAYDILGRPRSAPSSQVRSRYHQLIRGFKKDLSTSQLFSDEQFRQWTNAYLTLYGNERSEYDRRLRQNNWKALPEDKLDQLSEGWRLYIQAETAFARRKLNDAVELAKSAVKIETREAKAYALLGDILREQSRYANALTMYNYAVQFDPNNRRYWQGLQEVTALRDGKAIPSRFRGQQRQIFQKPAWMWALLGLVIITLVSSVYIFRANPGTLIMLNLPRNFLYFGIGNGFLLGLILAATSLIGPFDDELLWYQVPGFGTETTPIGIFIAIPGIVFFWIAHASYLLISALDEHFSLSLAIVLGICALATIAFSFAAPEQSHRTIQLLGGNFIFLGFLFGWLFGSIRRRVFEH